MRCSTTRFNTEHRLNVRGGDCDAKTLPLEGCATLGVGPSLPRLTQDWIARTPCRHDANHGALRSASLSSNTPHPVILSAISRSHHVDDLSVIFFFLHQSVFFTQYRDITKVCQTRRESESPHALSVSSAMFLSAWSAFSALVSTMPQTSSIRAFSTSFPREGSFFVG